MRRSRSLQDIEHLLDAEAIDKLCAAFGGTELYFKKSYGDDDELVGLLGREIADAIAAEFGGDFLLLPVTLGRRARVRALLAQEPKLTNREIALKAGVHIREVYRVLSDMADDRQTSLPL